MKLEVGLRVYLDGTGMNADGFGTVVSVSPACVAKTFTVNMDDGRVYVTTENCQQWWPATDGFVKAHRKMIRERKSFFFRHVNVDLHEQGLGWDKAWEIWRDGLRVYLGLRTA